MTDSVNESRLFCDGAYTSYHLLLISLDGLQKFHSLNNGVQLPRFKTRAVKRKRKRKRKAKIPNTITAHLSLFHHYS